MTKALFIPADPDLPMRLVELHDHEKYGNNPYFTTQEYIGDFTERVTTPHEDIHMFVDESGQLKNLQPNRRASAFYPGPIAGDVVLTHLDLVFEHGEPNHIAANIDYDFLLAVHRHFFEPIEGWTP